MQRAGADFSRPVSHTEMEPCPEEGMDPTSLRQTHGCTKETYIDRGQDLVLFLVSVVVPSFFSKQIQYFKE